MSKTGRYIYDTDLKKVVKISDEVGVIEEPIYCPSEGYFDIALQRRFESKSQKRKYMKENGLRMDGSYDKKHKSCEAGVRRIYSYNGQTSSRSRI